MNYRVWYILSAVFMLFSCRDLVLKKENSQNIVKEKWNELDKNEVEQPPLFKHCRGKTEEELEKCFHQTITNHVQKDLSGYSFTIQGSINDTIWIPLVVTKKGNILLETFKIPDSIEAQIPSFKNIVSKSISTLSAVKPAHIRSTPVSARYKLPIVIQLE